VLRPLRLALLILLTWACLGVFFASQNRVLAAENGVADQPDAVPGMALAVLISAFFTPFVIYAAERLPLRPPDRFRNTLLLAVTGLLISAVRLAVDIAFLSAYETGSWSFKDYRELASLTFTTHLLFFTAITFVAKLWWSRAEAEERGRREAELASALVQAQLRRLRADLHPHFLFNSLNAVATLVHTDPPAARETIAKLRHLLAQALQADRNEVPLEKELSLLVMYLDLQKVRFGDRLRTSVDVAETRLLEARVPPLLLQPLVENSVLHGVRKASGGAGSIGIRVFAAGNDLRLQVRDDGPGCDPEAPFSAGKVGVTNTRARLELLYRNAQSLRFTRDGTEFVADVRLPLHFE
jgi:two-component system LytT family sensor kinase